MGKQRPARSILANLLLAATATALPFTPMASVSVIGFYQQKASMQRKAFEEKTGILISGLPSEVEGKAYKLTELADVIAKEQREMRFDLARIEMDTPNPLLKSPSSLYKWLTSGNLRILNTNGYLIYETNPVFRNVMGLLIDPPGAFRNASHHEIKHRKLEILLREHPELKVRARWEAILREGHRSPIYMSPEEQERFNSRASTAFQRNPNLRRDSDAEQDRIFEYSRANFQESVACLTSLAEMTHTDPRYVLRSMEKEPKLEEIFALADELKLIPPRTLAYLELARHEEKIGKSWQDDQAYLIESLQFLNNDRDTPYETRIRLNRGTCLKNLGFASGNIQWFWNAEDEYKQGLKTANDLHSYGKILEAMSDMYARTGMPRLAKTLSDAKKEYDKRYDAGNPDLATRGVNDTLKAKNII
ncbi:hypothetical protein JW826_00280 [Candidatus Woesearchaeota archaeon]|nr:hypothetical protein [Candidatus Woesearchaeota archaeon]